MTTIAVDLKRMAMASDSCITDGNTIFSGPKIFVADDGTLIAISGTYSDAILFVGWYKAGANRKRMPKYEDNDVAAITLNKDGCNTWRNSGVAMPVKSTFYATGSGGSYAMAAMHCGKSLEEAIELACKLDPANCQAPVVCIAYHPIKPKPKRAPRKPRS